MILVSSKAVKLISVMVYDISTEAYYSQKGEEVALDIDLSGVGATFQLDLPIPPGVSQLHRHRQLVRLPQLKVRRVRHGS